MSLARAADQYEAWLRNLEQSLEPLFTDARAKLVAIQSRPEADEKISQVEELLRAKLEPPLLESAAPLEPIQAAVERYFAEAAEPSQRDYAIQERVGQGVDLIRDRIERRIASLVAQARANELQAAAPGAAQRTPSVPPPRVAAAPPSAGPDSGPPAGMSRFCVGCGARLGPPEWNARRCTQCGVTL